MFFFGNFPNFTNFTEPSVQISTDVLDKTSKGKKKKRTNKKKKKVSSNILETAPESTPTNDESDSDESIVEQIESVHINEETINKTADLDSINFLTKAVSEKLSLPENEVLFTINKMWELGLKYDDEFEVIDYIKKQQPSKEEPENLKTSEESTQKSTKKQKGKAKEASNTQTNSNPTKETQVTKEETKIEVEVNPISIEDQLALVAQMAFTNLKESLVALCKWVEIDSSAKQTAQTTSLPLISLKTKYFFNSKAFEILLSAVLCQEEAWIDHSEIHQLFTKLLSYLLPPTTSISMELITKMIDKIVIQIKLIRNHHGSSTLNDKKRSSDLLAQQLANSVRITLNKIDQFQSQNLKLTIQPGNLTQINDEIYQLIQSTQQISSSLNLQQEIQSIPKDQIKTLFHLRELQYEQLNLLVLGLKEETKDSQFSETFQTLKQTISQELLQNDLNLETLLIQENNIQNNSNKIFDKQQHHHQQNHQNQKHLEQLKVQIQQERDQRLHLIQVQKASIQTKLNEFQLTKENLFHQLQFIENEIHTWSLHLSNLDKSYEELMTNYHHKIQSISVSVSQDNHIHQKQHQPPSQQLPQAISNENIKHLMQSIKALEEQFVDLFFVGSKSTTSISHSTKQSSISTLYPQLTSGNLQSSFNQYIRSEQKCVEFLINRIQATKPIIEHANKEIGLYSTLGLKNVIEDCELRIRKANEEINQDIQTIEQILEFLNEIINNMNLVVKKNPSKDQLSYEYVKLIVNDCLKVNVNVPSNLLILTAGVALPMTKVIQTPVKLAPVVEDIKVPNELVSSSPSSLIQTNINTPAKTNEPLLPRTQTAGPTNANYKSNNNNNNKNRKNNKNNNNNASTKAKPIDPAIAIQALEKKSAFKTNTSKPSIAKETEPPTKSEFKPKEIVQVPPPNPSDKSFKDILVQSYAPTEDINSNQVNTSFSSTTSSSTLDYDEVHPNKESDIITHYSPNPMRSKLFSKA